MTPSPRASIPDSLALVFTPTMWSYLGQYVYNHRQTRELQENGIGHK